MDANPPGCSAGRVRLRHVPGIACALALALTGLLAACGGGGGGGGSTTGLHSTVATLTPLAASDTCPSGGQQIDYGIDENGNGVLDDNEVDGSVTICNGADGSAVVLDLTDEGPNESCAFGGTRLDIGWDNGANGGTAGDGALDQVANTYHLCNRGGGISEGSVSTPIVLTPGTLRHATVSARGASFYQFVAPVAWKHVVALTRTDSDLAWKLYSDAAFSAQVGATCDSATGVDEDERCTTPTLSKSATYYLKVEEHSNIPNLYDLAVAEDAFLIAAEYDGKLFRIDPQTAAIAYLSDTGIYYISAMVFDPATATLYAATESSGDCEACVYSVNPFTGDSVMIVDLYNAGVLYDIFGMTRDPTDGTQFVTAYGQTGPELHSFDPDTGLTTLAGSLEGALWDQWTGLTFDGSGTLYMPDDAGSNLYTLDPGTANESLVVSLTDDVSEQFLSLTVGPTDGKLFAATDDYRLVTIDPCDGQVSEVGPFYDTLDGLALVGASRLPTPPPCADALAGNNKVTVSWRSYPAASAFNLYWATAPGIDPADAGTYAGKLSNVSSPYEHTGRTNGVPYYYVVTAVVAGREVASAEVSDIPPGPQ